MKEFMVVVRCKNADELKSALEEAASEVYANSGLVDEMEVDEPLDITAGPAEEISLQRCS